MIDRVTAKSIVPVVVLDDTASAEPLAEALLEGGLDIMEITFRTPAAESSIRRIASRFPEILLGAGTLLDPDQVARAKDAGAVFGLAPGLNPAIVAKAREVGLQFSPGVMTPSDLECALSLGCNLLKFFPAEVAGGTAMLVRAPDGVRATVPFQAPPAGALAAVVARLREAFDPAGVLNPGRLYPET